VNAGATPDLTRTFLVILILTILIVGSVWTMLAFLAALLWASALVISTWPLLLEAQRWTGGRRGLAAAAMTLLIGTIFVVPFALTTSVLLDAAIEGLDLAESLMSKGMPPPPAWLNDIPLIGERLTTRWKELSAGGADAAMDAFRPYLRSTAGWAMNVTGGFAMILVHFVLTLIIVAILYTNGETAARGVLLFARRIGRERAERSVRLAAQAVRGVALGVVVTAFIQSVIAGLGLVLTGVPRPALLVAIVFALCIAQLGPLLVLVPAVIWLFATDHETRGVVLVLFTIVAAVSDNFLKPILIRRGVDLPLLLIIAGVIGGILSFGVMGLFIGPVVLAVTYTLLVEWVRNDDANAPPRASTMGRD
jgi:predicted PurR-regulated permease PerM